MMNLVDLPTEILVQVFASLDSLRDAANLSKTCRQFDLLINDTRNMGLIFDAIADNILLPETPDTAWLETHFGPDCLWKPSRSEIAPRISHAKTLEFLTTIGFPDRSTGLHGVDLQHLRKNIEQGKHETWLCVHNGPRGQNWTVRDPEAHYTLGFVGQQKVIVGSTNGNIITYTLSVRDLGHWPMGATSIISFLVLLGTAVSSRDAIKELIQRSSDPLKLAVGVWFLEKVYFKMNQYDVFLDKGSRFWWELLFDGMDYNEISRGPHTMRWEVAANLSFFQANIVMPKNPDSAWLKTHFRVEKLKTPDARVLAMIEHVETRTFLSTVGFPDFSTRTAHLSSKHMLGRFSHGINTSAFNADIRDEDPPMLAGSIFFFGATIECGVFFGTGKGDVIFCVFPGASRTPVTDKHLCLGSAATSVSSFLVLLGTFLEFRRQVQEVIDLCTLSELQPRLYIYQIFLRRVYERMREYGDLPERYDSFWHDICGNFNPDSPFFHKKVDHGSNEMN
ncbi:F-box protein [Aspergillus thermomutatus]|uniref:F-box domain-containing protein n=1 Tax=Aspergillus thermomutatus TaxID=41047 RepID=A0A397HJR4_ASPTH|nr:uncharacterized protein CDV56_108625 [Aspergillus thermomutatus]RHZ61826.1 hypothetical protein CDV56_108625 [Aspergillus thermomutatus]